MEQDQFFARQLAAINSEFAEQLPQMGREIAKLWAEVRQGVKDDEPIQELIHLIHNLAGAGGAFGFPWVTDSARQIIRHLHQITASPAEQIGPDEALRLDGYLSELVAICEGKGHLQSLGDAEVGAEERQIQPPSRRQLQLIYLVADAGPERTDMANRIGSYGYQVACYASISEAQQAQEESLPLGVVVDINVLHPLSGADLSKLDMPSLFQVPVVLLSEEDDFATRLASVRGGAQGFFAKPVDTDKLVSFVEGLAPREDGEPYRVLIIDDDRKQGEYHALILQWAGMRTRVVTDPEAVLDQVAEFDPELLLVDVYMPGCNGIELASILRQMEGCRAIPIVFLSIEPQLDPQLEAMKTGADDYLAKPVQPQQLVSSVNIRAWRSRSQRLLMVNDSLTSLYNHGVVMERLEYMTLLAERQKGVLCAARLDLDNFTQINDAHGHGAGDQVLITFARLLRQRLRVSDIMGRFAGDEFLVVLPDTPLSQAQCLLDELRVLFTGITFPSRQAGVEFTVTFSGGVAEFPSLPNSKALLVAADELLDKAKREGGDRIEIAIDGPDAASA